MIVMFYIPHGLIGGAEKQLESLLRALPSEVEPVVVYTHEAVAEFVRGFNVPFTRAYSGPNILKAIKKVKPAIVQSNVSQFFPNSFLYRALERLEAPPVCLGIMHDRLWKPAFPLSTGRFSAVVGVSRGAAEHATEHVIVKGVKCFQIPNGVDTSIFHKGVRAQYVRPDVAGRRPCGGFCGRLCEAKAISELIGIASEIPDADFELVGDGGAAYVNEIRERGITNVRIYPHSEKVTQFYGRWDFFVSRAPAEGFGLSIAEAVCCGIPSVVWNCGGVTEFLRNREDCLSVSSGAEMRSAIRTILDGRWQPNELGRADLSSERMSRSYVELYETLSPNRLTGGNHRISLEECMGGTMDKFVFSLKMRRAALLLRRNRRV